VCSGHLTVEQHVKHLASLVQGLTKVDESTESKIRTSEAFADFQKYIYFSSCRKIKKRLDKGVRIGKKVRSFSDTLFAIEPMLALRLVSATPLPGRPLDEDSGLSQDEDWIKEYAGHVNLELTLDETSTTVKHIKLDLGGIANFQKLIRGNVKAITDLINKICHVYSKYSKVRLVRGDEVLKTAKEVHHHLAALLPVTWFLRRLLNFSPSLRRFLQAVPASSVFC
jgi:hypothetical protein